MRPGVWQGLCCPRSVQTKTSNVGAQHKRGSLWYWPFHVSKRDRPLAERCPDSLPSPLQTAVARRAAHPSLLWRSSSLIRPIGVLGRVFLLVVNNCPVSAVVGWRVKKPFNVVFYTVHNPLHWLRNSTNVRALRVRADVARRGWSEDNCCCVI